VAVAVADPAGDAKARLLVVEDEPTIVELLSGALRFAGFEVTTATTAGAALKAVAADRPDLIVLDVMLPDQDGFEVLRRIRGQGSDIPVLFLTARHAVTDRVAGLTLGADDYVVKPFSLDEVVARIRAILRRGHSAAREPTRLTVADLELDEAGREAWRGGKPIPLTPTEYKLLRYLMLNAGRVLSRAQILDHIWEYDFNGEGNVIESYISYLRRKIDTGEPRLIHTIRGIGYVLRVPPP
jgi:two-component system OmpR family response regulator